MKSQLIINKTSFQVYFSTSTTHFQVGDFITGNTFLSYYVNDYWNIFGIIGLNEFKSRTKLDLAEPDIQIDNNLALGGLTYTYDWFDITYLVSAYKQNIDSQSIIAMETFANFYGNYLKIQMQL